MGIIKNIYNFLNSKELNERLEEERKKNIDLEEKIKKYSSGQSSYSSFTDWRKNLLNDFKIETLSETVDEMLSDSDVWGSLYGYLSILKNCVFTVECENEEIKKSVENLLFEKIKLKEILGDIFSYIYYGFSAFEKYYIYEEGKVFPLMSMIHQSSLDSPVIEKDRISYWLQTNSIADSDKEIKIMGEDLFYFTFQKEGINVLGRSIFYHIYKDYYFKNVLYELNQNSETKQSGFLHVKNGSQEDNSTLELKFAEASATGKGAVMTNNEVEASFVNNNISGSSSVIAAINLHKEAIKQGLFTQFTMLGMSSQSGSHALGKETVLFFEKSLNYIIDYVTSVLHKNIVSDFVKLNFGEYDCQLKITLNTEIDDKLMLEFLKNGIIQNDEEIEEIIRQKFKLPKKKKEISLSMGKGDRNELGKSKSKRLPDVYREEIRKKSKIYSIRIANKLKKYRKRIVELVVSGGELEELKKEISLGIKTTLKPLINWSYNYGKQTMNSELRNIKGVEKEKEQMLLFGKGDIEKENLGLDADELFNDGKERSDTLIDVVVFGSLDKTKNEFLQWGSLFNVDELLTEKQLADAFLERYADRLESGSLKGLSLDLSKLNFHSGRKSGEVGKKFYVQYDPEGERCIKCNETYNLAINNTVKTEDGRKIKGVVEMNDPRFFTPNVNCLYGTKCDCIRTPVEV